MSVTSVPDDPFAALGLERRFVIDPAALQRAWLARLARVHPDHAGAGEPGTEGASSARDAAVVNRAHATLRSPEQRASALLGLLGGPSAAQDPSLPQGFLIEILEIRERLEEARASGDPVARRELKAWAHDERRRAEQEVGAMFEALGPAPGVEALGAIRKRLNAWRYIERMIEQLDPALGA